MPRGRRRILLLGLLKRNERGKRRLPTMPGRQGGTCPSLTYSISVYFCIFLFLSLFWGGLLPYIPLLLSFIREHLTSQFILLNCILFLWWWTVDDRMCSCYWLLPTIGCIGKVCHVHIGVSTHHSSDLGESLSSATLLP